MQDQWNAFHIGAPGRSEHLLWLVGRKNTKEDIDKFHSLIKPEQQFVMTFHFLACGENKKTLNFSFRTDELTVSMIIVETAEAIYSSLWGKYLNLPCASQAWVEISKNFENIWDFPHHIIWETYQDSMSNVESLLVLQLQEIFLLVVCNAKYCFTLSDLRQEDVSNNDSRVLMKSKMNKSFENEKLNIPQSSHINFLITLVP